MFIVYVVASGIHMWTYGRLFRSYGKPVVGAFTDPGSNFLGIYYLRNNETGIEYEVEVVTDLFKEYLDKNSAVSRGLAGDCPKCGNQVSTYALNGHLCPNCRHMFLQANYGN